MSVRFQSFLVCDSISVTKNCPFTSFQQLVTCFHGPVKPFSTIIGKTMLINQIYIVFVIIEGR